MVLVKKIFMFLWIKSQVYNSTSYLHFKLIKKLDNILSVIVKWVRVYTVTFKESRVDHSEFMTDLKIEINISNVLLQMQGCVLLEPKSNNAVQRWQLFTFIV